MYKNYKIQLNTIKKKKKSVLHTTYNINKLYTWCEL